MAHVRHMFDLTSALFPDATPPRLRPGPYAPLQQSSLYARATRMVGARATYITLPGTGAWVMQRRLPVLGEVALISRGPPELSSQAAKDLRSASDASHLVVNAEDDMTAEALAAAGFWRIARRRVIAELDLLPSADAMAAQLSGKWRNRLRHAQRQHLHVKRTPFPPSPRHWLFAAEATASRHLGYQPLPAILTAAFAAARPGAAQLFVARTHAGPIAAMLFIRHGKMATYQTGWSNTAGRAASAGNLLMWRAMVELQAMGVDRLDLGAADPTGTPGLAHFKTGTGAQTRALGGTWMTSAVLPTRPRRTNDVVLARLRELASDPKTPAKGAAHWNRMS